MLLTSTKKKANRQCHKVDHISPAEKVLEQIQIDKYRQLPSQLTFGKPKDKLDVDRIYALQIWVSLGERNIKDFSDMTRMTKKLIIWRRATPSCQCIMR